MNRIAATGNSRPPILDLLARAIERHTPRAGDHATDLPALSLHRRDAPTEPVQCIYDFGLALTAQGSKQVMVGEKVVGYGPGESMLTPIGAPIVAHITRATRREPYLALLLRLDTRSIAMAVSQMELPRSDEDGVSTLISIEKLEPPILEALYRLIEALDDQPLLPHVAPLFQQEVIFRLLIGRHGSHLRRLVAAESTSQQIAGVVVWIKQNFAESIAMDELAAKANMSSSTFRQHFHEVTGMSPLQFQKQLRLQEARQLMLNQSISAGQAAYLVGYASASQFSREYSRLFGASPLHDVRRVRSSREYPQQSFGRQSLP